MPLKPLILIFSLLACSFAEAGVKVTRPLEPEERTLIEATKDIELNPNDPSKHWFRGVIWSLVGEHERAIKDFNKALSLNPDFKNAHIGRELAYYNIARKRNNNTAPTLTISNVTSIYDGDTFRAAIENYPKALGKDIGIRLYGIDAPEIKGVDPQTKTAAREARDYLAKRLNGAKQIILKKPKRGKYFRIVAEVIVDDIDLGQELIAAGLATTYPTDKKELSQLKKKSPAD